MQINNSECRVLYILGCIASVPIPCKSARVGQEQFRQHKTEARAKRSKGPLLQMATVYIKGPLQDHVTWYRIKYAMMQIMQWDF